MVPFENGQYITWYSVDENNTGDGQTLSCIPQESPSSEISGPTIDVSMSSGKKKAHFFKKICVVYRNH